MSSLQVLLITGTHGNEINGPWLFKQWSNNPELINTYGIEVVCEIGNRSALEAGQRYIDRDLNRCFNPELLALERPVDEEVHRAQELLGLYGLKGSNPCNIVIDFHSTTSAMGSCLVVYGRRPADLALAALIQARLGLPVYLHEGDHHQMGFLVEGWPCGLVVEIGPVPQGVLQARIFQQTLLALEASLEVLAYNSSDLAVFPDRLIVHRHLGSLDFPRDLTGQVTACTHSQLQGKDWHPLSEGSLLFLKSDGTEVRFGSSDSQIPVFINEAAYMEKHIAMSLTKREVWNLLPEWKIELQKLTA